MMQLMLFRAMQGLSFYPNDKVDAFSSNAGAFLLPK
jgi:hypothetical protein